MRQQRWPQFKMFIEQLREDPLGLVVEWFRSRINTGLKQQGIQIAYQAYRDAYQLFYNETSEMLYEQALDTIRTSSSAAITEFLESILIDRIIGLKYRPTKADAPSEERRIYRKCKWLLDLLIANNRVQSRTATCTKDQLKALWHLRVEALPELLIQRFCTFVANREPRVNLWTENEFAGIQEKEMSITYVRCDPGERNETDIEPSELGIPESV